MLNAMVQSDLENIDYDAIRILNGGFELNARDLYGEFKFALKDGRIFVCKQDLDEVYIVNSDKAGTIYCNLWGDMAGQKLLFIVAAILPNLLLWRKTLKKQHKILQATWVT